MPFLDLAGTPAVRFPDPKIKRIRPDGSQPYTAYQAPLVYAAQTDSYSPLLTAPPDFLAVELLLFGSDYPTKIGGVQQFEQQVYDETGALFPLYDLAFPLPPSPLTALSDAILTVIPSLAFDPYKKIATGATTTNGVVVSGYPAVTFAPSRNIFATDTGSAGDRASFGVQLDVTLNGPVVDGPASYVPYATASTNFLVPVILWEPDLTQEIVDNGYLIENVLFGGNAATLDVVGLWASGDYAPVGPRLGARAFSAEPASAPSVSVYSRASDLIAARKAGQ
jgi:hypothetical protein